MAVMPDIWKNEHRTCLSTEETQVEWIQYEKKSEKDALNPCTMCFDY